MLFLLLALLLQDQPTFRADVALVRVEAEVRNEAGPVADLTKESFRVTDNGRLQNLLYFAHEDQPLDLILLFDTSASMRPAVARVAQAAHSLLGELRGGDRIAIMAFDSTTDVVIDFTGDFAAAERSIRDQVLKRRFRCCSPIQAAIAEAARHFRIQPAGLHRRAIVVITDDEGTSKSAGTLREAWEADAIVLGVNVRRPGHSISITLGPPSAYGYKGMRLIAVKTGGDSLDTNDAAEGLRQMIHRLRERYSLYYDLPQVVPGEERKIDVQLTREVAKQHPRAVVRARTGYIAPL